MWQYRAAVVEVHDGDTLTLEIDQGFGGRQQESIRLAGVQAPELLDPGGVAARNFARDWVAAAGSRRWPLLLETSPTLVREPSERRSFVRYIGTVSRIDSPKVELNADVIAFLTGHPEWGHGIT